MVAPEFLRKPSTIKWLGGIEPAWTMLDLASFEALRGPSHPTQSVFRLADDFLPAEVQQSAVARNALILMQAAAEAPGLKMTATGNLSRAVVAQMWELFSWPDFDREQALGLNKVINEPDFLPLYFVRQVVESSGFLQRYKGHLRITPSGRKMLEEANSRSLPAVLFHNAMWRMDLGYLGRGLHQRWPLQDAGVVLWSLSVAANDWESPTKLVRLCTIPMRGMFDTEWDTAAMAMEARGLRPLLWFGLLDHRRDKIEGVSFGERHFYRKTPLFDRMLSFRVILDSPSGSAH